MLTLRLAAVLVLPIGPVAAQERPATWRLSERPLLSIGSQDSEGPELFGRVAGAVRQRSGAVLVAEGASKELRLFSATGRHIGTFGRAGAGPGEFRTMVSVRRCTGDSTFVYDAVLRRISVFSPTGSYVRAIETRTVAGQGLPPYDFWCNSAGALAAVHRSAAPPDGIGPRRPNVAITLVTPDGRLLDLGTFPASERYFLGSEDIPRPLGKRTSIALGSRSVYVGTGDAFEVVEFSVRGERLGTLRHARPVLPVTAAHVSRYIAEQVRRRSGRGRLDRKARETLYRDLEYPRTFPAYARLLVDAGDNLWIEEYPLPGADHRGWSVFSNPRVAIAVIRVPSNFEILEIGTDHVLGVWRDELDVEYVRVYGLIK